MSEVTLMAVHKLVSEVGLISVTHTGAKSGIDSSNPVVSGVGLMAVTHIGDRCWFDGNDPSLSKKWDLWLH